jgi:hypothetical protein
MTVWCLACDRTTRHGFGETVSLYQLRNKTMKYVIATAVVALFAIAPAQAAGKLKCNGSSMKKVEMMIHEAMADPKMKKMEAMAMHENEMAASLKKKGDKKGCAMHLNMAQESLMKHG